MSNYLFHLLVTFFVLIGLMLLHGFFTATFTSAVINFESVLASYKAPMIIAFAFSVLFAWVKVSE